MDVSSILGRSELDILAMLPEDGARVEIAADQRRNAIKAAREKANMIGRPGASLGSSLTSSTSSRPSKLHQPQPDVSYEHRERQHIAERDWAGLHVAADRRSPLGFFDRVRRTWR
jgi:hypothetical protein